MATGALPDAMRDVGDGHRGRASKNRAQSSHKAAAALVRTARASKKTTDDTREGRAGVFSQRLRTRKALRRQARRRSRRIQAKSIFV